MVLLAAKCLFTVCTALQRISLWICPHSSPTSFPFLNQPVFASFSPKLPIVPSAPNHQRHHLDSFCTVELACQVGRQWLVLLVLLSLPGLDIWVPCDRYFNNCDPLWFVTMMSGLQCAISLSVTNLWSTTTLTPGPQYGRSPNFCTGSPRRP